MSGEEHKSLPIPTGSNDKVANAPNSLAPPQGANDAGKARLAHPTMSPLSLSPNAKTIDQLMKDNHPTPATEKAIASIAPMLEAFTPKTNAEDSASRLGSISLPSPYVSSSSALNTHSAGSTEDIGVIDEVAPLTVENVGEIRSKANSFSMTGAAAAASASGSAPAATAAATTGGGSGGDGSKLNKTISNTSNTSRKLFSQTINKVPEHVQKKPSLGKIGVCAMDAKALSKPCRKILNRLIENGEFETVIFGDKVILDETIENWPTCDFLISFFSTGFPLEKAIAYVNYRKPFLINDLVFQKALWDRRVVLAILNHANVPSPERLEISRDGGPQLEEQLQERMKEVGFTDDQLHALSNQQEPEWEMVDEDTLRVGDKIMKKPFVEKPVDGEDHNVYIYYPKSTGGGGRRLFRKIGNKSSEFDPNLTEPRTDGSFIYESFMDTDNFEDVKAYTVGPNFCHAETRKSPVVDGIVRRNTHGKEIRYVTELSNDEKQMAKSISAAFMQTICGFDLLRVNGKSYVIDVNGFSFVKDNNEYYDSCANILRSMFVEAKKSRDLLKNKVPLLLQTSQFEQKEQKWVFKGMVTVIRHADRTPKQKFKYSFKSPLFISLLKGHTEEVIIRAVPDLQVVLETVKIAEEKQLEDRKKLKQLRIALEKKINFPGTKIQIKPSLNAENPEIVDKVQFILKWGGEPTHSAKHQATDVGEQMRQNLKLLNREALNDVKVYTSSERRVITSAQYFTTSLLGLTDEHLPEDFLIVRKDLLDDSNAAKDLMDKVKKKLKPLLRQGAEAPPQFTWPPKMPQPFEVIKRVCELMNFHHQIMKYNFETKDVQHFQENWCCGEDPFLFKERWDKLFQEFISVEKTHPSKISELYDTMKYDALHNRHFLQKIFEFDPNDEQLLARLRETCGSTVNSSGLVSEYPINLLAMNNFKIPSEGTSVSSSHNNSSTQLNPSSLASAGSLGWVLSGATADIKQASGGSGNGNGNGIGVDGVSSSSNTSSSTSAGSSTTVNGNGSGNGIGKNNNANASSSQKGAQNPFDHATFTRLRELYRLSKVLFDFICPQEYGIKDEEKLDIGLLTSLPLAKQILSDIQDMKKDASSPSVVNYFTKESHIYTLLNVIYGAQLPMKIARNALPELDYLSQIVFELYEADDPTSPQGKKHSIRLSLSPGCHTQDPLDVQLDDDHYIGCIPRLSLTRHLDMDLVTQRLKSRFSRVSLPKKFTPVNISSPLASGI